MALLDIIKKGSTSRSVSLFVYDNTTGLGKTGLTYVSAGIDLWYRRERSAVVSITEVTIAGLTTAFTTAAGGAGGSFIEVGMGYYSLDIPDAALATGVNWVDIGGTFTGYTVVGGRIRLVDVDLEDTVRFGLTAMPAVASGSAGAILTSGTGTAQLAVSGGRGNADVLYWNAAAVGAPNTAGYPVVDVTKNAGTNITAASGRAEVNTTHFNGTAAVTATAGIPSTNLATWLTVAPLALTSQKVQTSVVDVQAGGIVAASLAADAITAAKVAADVSAEIAAAMLATVVESQGSITLNQLLQYTLSALAGVTDGSGVFKTPNGTSTRITATLAANARTAITLNSA